ncbi:MAG TPA: hypothetical protein VH234_05310 [Candidatus Saccharimonadales bacterium]|jgi:hypothetical protein|nr:hypothetical protein [Candidatus Saccharimonadales bacterium]
MSLIPRLEIPELTAPNFCEGCPALPTCGIKEPVILRAGQRQPVNIYEVSYHLGEMIPEQFVVVSDASSASPEPVLLGSGEYQDSGLIAQRAISRIDRCKSPQEEVTKGFIRKQKVIVCGAGAVRFSQRWRSPYGNFAEDLRADELTDPQWANVLYPPSLKAKLMEELQQAIAEAHPDPLDAQLELARRSFMAGFNGAGVRPEYGLAYRSITQADHHLAEQRRRLAINVI